MHIETEGSKNRPRDPREILGTETARCDDSGDGSRETSAICEHTGATVDELLKNCEDKDEKMDDRNDKINFNLEKLAKALKIGDQGKFNKAKEKLKLLNNPAHAIAIHMENVDLDGWDLTGISFSLGHFKNVNFGSAKLTRTNFGGATFEDCTFNIEDLDKPFFDRPPLDMAKIIETDYDRLDNKTRPVIEAGRYEIRIRKLQNGKTQYVATLYPQSAEKTGIGRR